MTILNTVRQSGEYGAHLAYFCHEPVDDIAAHADVTRRSGRRDRCWAQRGWRRLFPECFPSLLDAQPLRVELLQLRLQPLAGFRRQDEEFEIALAVAEDRAAGHRLHRG